MEKKKNKNQKKKKKKKKNLAHKYKHNGYYPSPSSMHVEARSSQPPTFPYSSVNFLYSSGPIKPSTSPFPTSILAIHPSDSGYLLITPGFSSSKSFLATTFPERGVKISDADFTDSTAPIVSPALHSVSMVGSSMKTTSPRACAAYVEMPIVPLVL